ncbi:MAG: type II toxin-antitoxin system RelE/ParE family toxin [bacterium]|nr:type II toxin-antitoxin system RelE/ParE family toxin [bacterium]
MFAAEEFVPASQGFEQQAARRLAILNAAPSLDTLRALPGNRLEMLRGARKGQYSIRINRQWRICFTWSGDLGPADVEIVDYH